MPVLKNAAPVFIVSGTRPEIIKLAPVHAALRQALGEDRVAWIATGQHRELADTVLDSFGIESDVTLDIRRDGGALHQLHARGVTQLTRIIAERKPALIVVQGDTVSALAGASAAFHAGVPLAHVEAGLRTYNTHNPYPEEAYRRMIDAMADLRFAPTRHAANNLRDEKMQDKTIWVTGNTVVDALESLKLLPEAGAPGPGRRLVLVTLHRRESWGDVLANMCRALADIARANPDVEIVLPLHVNPNVRETILPILDGDDSVRLIEPVAFDVFHRLMKRATLIMTDSGGIQEEAPSYGVPTLVLRESTERPEAIESGQAILVGTDRFRIVAEGNRLLASRAERTRMTAGANPFGDGRAGWRIACAIRRFLDGETELLTADEEFSPQAALIR